MSPENAKLLSNLAVVDALLGKKQDALGEARHAVEMRAASKDALAGPGIRGSSGCGSAGFGASGSTTFRVSELFLFFLLPALGL
jgi:hypothetical protein